jgi:hypothetical protein
MRTVILVTSFLALAPFAYAQSNTGTMGGMSGPGTTGTMGGMNHMGRAGATTAAPMTTGQPDPGNCGTPDEPKRCPPMPRRALQTYPANRQ